jgi:hypothetical protein
VTSLPQLDSDRVRAFAHWFLVTPDRRRRPPTDEVQMVSVTAVVTAQRLACQDFSGLRLSDRP